MKSSPDSFDFEMEEKFDVKSLLQPNNAIINVYGNNSFVQQFCWTS